jgi:hypothetical protein
MIVACKVCRLSFAARRVTAQFCSARCRKTAQRTRARRPWANVTLTRSPPGSAVGARSPKPSARPPARPASSGQHAASAAADVTLRGNTPVGVEPDRYWSNMWRVKYADGRLSDMVNLTRARDALQPTDSARRNLMHVTPSSSTV